MHIRCILNDAPAVAHDPNDCLGRCPYSLFTHKRHQQSMHSVKKIANPNCIEAHRNASTLDIAAPEKLSKHLTLPFHSLGVTLEACVPPETAQNDTQLTLCRAAFHVRCKVHHILLLQRQRMPTDER